MPQAKFRYRRLGRSASPFAYCAQEITVLRNGKSEDCVDRSAFPGHLDIVLLQANETLLASIDSVIFDTAQNVVKADQPTKDSLR